MTRGLVAVAVAALVAAAAAPAAPGAVVLACWSAGAAGLVHARRRGRSLVALLAVVAVVAGATGARLHHQQHGVLVERATTAGSAEVVLRVVGEPVPTLGGRWRTDVAVLLLDGVRSGQRAELGGTDRHTFGATYAGRVEVRPAPGGWRRSRHVVAVLGGAQLEQVRPPGRLVGATTRVRRALASAASAVLPPGRAGLATGLVTGDTSLLPPADDEAMRATGLTHLTAVSGSNVALVVAGVWLLAGVLRLGARGRRRTAVAAVLLFAVLTRADPSVLRASAMALVVLLARTRGRRVQALHALAGAVLVLVLLDPLLARRLGLLLSAAATAGVLVVAPRVRARLEPLRVVVRSRRLLDLLAVTLGAQVAVLPVLLGTGDEIAVATVPANLVAVPAAALASVLCTAAAVVAVPVPDLAEWLLRLATPFLAVVLRTARSLQWWGPTVGPEAPAALLLALLVVTWLVVPRGTRVARGAAALAAGVIVVGALPLPGPPRGAFVLTAIDVGQGDAFLLTAGSTAVLVDAGRDGRAAAWLRRHGPDQLDLLVLTHGDSDHTGGAVAVLAAVDVAAVWQRPRAGPPPPALAAALDALAASDVPVHAPVRGQQASVGPLSLRVLAPPGPATHRGLDSEENEGSLVLRVDGPGGSVLLTGDIGPSAHDGLLGDPVTRALLDVDVLTIPHHGSRHVDLGLHAAATAHHAVVSVGAANRYGHPAPEVVAAAGAAGARVHRTDVDGTVSVVVTGDGAGGGTGGRVADDAPLHTGDLRRPDAAASGHRPRPARRPGRRRGGTHRRRGGGAAGRTDGLAVRRRHRPRPAVHAGAQRGRAGRGHRTGRVAR